MDYQLRLNHLLLEAGDCWMAGSLLHLVDGQAQANRNLCDHVNRASARIACTIAIAN